jgi:hypothetical protein
MDWLAEYAVAHTNLLLPGMRAAQLRARLVTTWHTRMSACRPPVGAAVGPYPTHWFCD